jgi:hypothetical protein
MPMNRKPIKMLQVIAGIVLIIAGVLVWTGTLTLIHGVAVFMVIVGLFILLTYVVPFGSYRRGRAS